MSRAILDASVRTVLFGIAVLLAGCALAPERDIPATQESEQYGVADPQYTTEAAGVSQEFARGEQADPRWWTVYQSNALNDLVEEGLRNNLDLETADRRLASARESLKAQIGSTRMPSVDLGGQAARQRDLGLPLPGMPNTSLYNTFVGQAQVRYTFDLFGAIRYENEALAERIGQQSYQQDAARQAVAANIVTGTIQLAALQAQREAMERLIRLIEIDVNDVNAQHAMGAVPKSTVLDARAHLASLASQLPALQSRIVATRHALALLLGRRPDQAPQALDFKTLVLPHRIPVAVPSTLLETRPDILAATRALNAASADVGAATANMFPRIALSASMGQAGFDWSTALSGAGAIWGLAASITQPLFHGGALRARRRAALQDYEATIAAYRQTVLSAFGELADSLAALENDAVALAQAEQLQRSTDELYETARQRVQLGALPRSASRHLAQQAIQAELDTLSYAATRLIDTARLFHAMAPALAEDP